MEPGNTKTAISPMLSVRRGTEAITFYEKAFGAAVSFRMDDETNGHVVAQLDIDGAEFWLSDESPEHANFCPETLNGSTTRIILTVDNPDDLFQRAIRAGATEILPVSDEHGWRLGRVVDPYGHHWEIGKPLA